MKCLLFGLLSALSACLVAQAPWQDHGALRVSDDGHYLVHADGTGFFWLGCTAWRLPLLDRGAIDRYLDDRVARGFNVIQFVANTMGEANFAGEYPFLGAGPPWQEVALRESYWEHIDYIVEQAAERGLYVACFLWWGTHVGDDPRQPQRRSQQAFADPDTDNYTYGKLIGQRYRAADNLIWVVAGEYHKFVSVMFPDNQRPLTEGHRNRLEQTARGLRDGDGGRHLMTNHPISFLSSSEEFHDAQWMDFNMIQSHAVPGFIVPLTLADWNRQPPKPTFNAEGWYEDEEELYTRWTGMTRTEGDAFDPAWIQRYQAYWSVFAGGIGYTYGHKNLWRMESLSGEQGVLDQKVLNAPGTHGLRFLRQLLLSKDLTTRVPAPELLSSGTVGRDGGLSPDYRIATREKDGHWAMVYSTRGSLIRVRMHRLATGAATAYWFDPRNGKTQEAFRRDILSGTDAPDVYFDPPGKSSDGNDWVLLLEIE